MITINDALANKILDAIFNGGAGVSIFNNATLTIRTGAAPGANNAASGTVLATITLPADAMGAAAARAIAKSGTWQDAAADAAGTAAHFRVTDGTYVVEGTVGASGSGADMIVDNTAFNTGQQFTVSSFSLSL